MQETIYKKKNILITIPDLYSKGGVSAFLNSLFEGFENFNDIHFIPLEIGGHGKNILGVISDQLSLNRLLKENSNIDLAFLNPSLFIKSFFRDGVFAKQLVKKDVPFVVFFHGWDLEFEKKIDKRFVNFFLNSFGKAEKIFILSPDFRDKILEWGYRGEIIVETTMVENSLLQQNYVSSFNEDKIKILFLSRIVKEKGIFEMIEAFENISKIIDDIELVIAGDGEDFQELKRRVSDIKNIQMVGEVRGEEKISLFKESDIYCLPSYSEGLPISVLEAMLFGLPVITTRVGGLKSFFKNEEMGYLIEPKGIDELEEKMKILILDRTRRLKMRKFNLKYAQNHLTTSVVTKRIYKHLKDILEC